MAGQNWDGFSVLVVLMIRDHQRGAMRSEMGWYEVLPRTF